MLRKAIHPTKQSNRPNQDGIVDTELHWQPLPPGRTPSVQRPVTQLAPDGQSLSLVHDSKGICVPDSGQQAVS